MGRRQPGQRGPRGDRHQHGRGGRVLRRGAFDPHAVRSALIHVQADTLIVAGEYDVGLPPKRAAEYADLFLRAELAVRPGSGHFPWLDDPEWFGRTVADHYF